VGSKQRPHAPPEITLRAARPADFDFALALYLESTKPLLLALGHWNEDRVRTRFAQDFKPRRARVIHNAGLDIGWIQVSETAESYHLDQLHIVDGHRNQGIGTRLIQALLNRARRDGKSVSLNVIRGNPAMYLYERLGFQFVGEEEDKLRMRWQSSRAPKPIKGRTRTSHMTRTKKR
jgi:ribosomal protein S18 acetylase RimI-like enzyme